MKRLIKTFLYLIATALLIVGCGKQNSNKSQLDLWMEEEGKLRVLSTTSMIGDLVERIGQDRIVHLTLMDGTVDPHSYELVKGDDEKLSRANLVFYNGLGLEHGASLHYALTHNKLATPVGDVLSTKCPERLLTIDGVIDPHIWMDINLFVETIDPIVETLSKHDPSYSHIFKKRGDQLREELLVADRLVYEMMQAINESNRYLVTSHDAFNYFARHYLATPKELETNSWQKRFQAPEGLAPDGQLGLHDLEQILNHLETYKIHYLFPESNVSLNSLKKLHSVAKAKGIDIHFSKTPLFGDSMSGEETSVSSYKEMVLHNAKVIDGFLNEK
ncbi:MAG: zinc ABC transporter substrate-binding protein [Rhabdochlamydiaceae bacterium]|nr:zinc ABC transporter substrate-binding protein [Candidatus Amphrikana amoebophyrae]